MAKKRKTKEQEYTTPDPLPDTEIILREMRDAFKRAEERIVRTHTEFRNTMINALFETMLETDRAKKEFVETTQELRELLYEPITEEDLPF